MKEPYFSIAIGKETTLRTFDFPDTQKGREQAHRVMDRLREYLEQQAPSPPAISGPDGGTS